MIGADQRSVLTEALTPPAGYAFDSGLATTYTLDLVTLLGLPLHLALIAGSVDQEECGLDPLATLEALRRTASRLTVFCDRGRMAAPRAASTLLGLLEPMVHEVESPHGGSFHPKVWLLRFVESKKADVRLTLLVLSRNITADDSWDLSLRMDGTPGLHRQSRNHPLCRLFEACIERAGLNRPLEAKRLADAKTLLRDAARCAWEFPGEFEDVVFHAIGIDTRPRPWLPRHASGHPWAEIGVVSPFVTAPALQQLASTAKSADYVVSRSEELALCGPGALTSFARYKVMEESTLTSDVEDDAAGRFRGLHAKLFIATSGANTHLFIGSANATSAALSGRNVEFMVELQGRKRRVGRPADLVNEDGMGPLLRDYTHVDSGEKGPDENDALLEDVRTALCAAPLRLECAAEDRLWAMRLAGFAGLPPGEVAVTAWSATVPGAHGVPLTGDNVLLGRFMTQELTCLTAFRLAVNGRELCFVLHLPASGLPSDRAQAILKAALQDQAAFLRYLQLLLGDLDGAGSAAGRRRGKGGRGASADADLPTFELLAQSLVDDPQRLRHLRQAVTDLQSGAEGVSVLPEGFLDLWRPFEQMLDEEDAGGRA